MFFDEARSLKQLHYKHSKIGNQNDFNQQHSRSLRRDKEISARFSTGNRSSQLTPSMAAEMLDSANNRLQELMQILYLLSRDPAVPNNARYHVTLAQSEIALLAREMRNSTEQQAAASATSAAPDVKSFSAAQP